MLQIKSIVISSVTTVVLGFIITGPVIGYVKAALSPQHVIEANHEMLAEQILKQASYGGDVLAESRSVQIEPAALSECESRLFRWSELGGKITSQISMNISAGIRYRYEVSLQNLMEEISPLNHFSWQQLGALKGCLDASIFAPICRRYVRNQLLGRDQQLVRNDKRVELRHLADKQTCEAADYLTR